MKEQCNILAIVIFCYILKNARLKHGPCYMVTPLKIICYQVDFHEDLGILDKRIVKSSALFSFSGVRHTLTYIILHILYKV